MSKQTQTHWREFFPNDFLHADELNGKEWPMKISKVQSENLKLPGGAESASMVISFEGAKKKLICNKTNTEAIAKTLKTPIIEKWIGQTVTLYPTTTKLKGAVVDCIRIKIQRGSLA